MKIGAVISEYNPFHNGHKYMLDEIRNKYQTDKIIVIMSGDFTERGEPALIGKELRAEHALKAGADLVIQLPLPYATGAADLFALGAVSILSRLNVVDYLFFGSECGDIDILSKIAELSNEYDNNISELMKNGITYAKARENVLSEYKEVLSSPNNILGIEYIKALKSLNSSIKPVTIKRTSDNYNSNEISENTFASAKAIRNAVTTGDFSQIATHVSDYTLLSLKESKCLFPDDLSDMIYHSILMNKDKLDSFMDISEDLANRINASLENFTSFTGLISSIKSKNYTYSRLSRGLLHILLNIKNDSSYYKDILPKLSHVKILGFRKSASDLFNMIGKESTISLTAKIPDVLKNCTEETKLLFEMELNSSLLYGYLCENNTHEYKRPVKIIDL